MMTNPFPVNQQPIDPIVKTRWVEALRSGNYKKGSSYLKKNDRYCCLGVLTEIQGINIEKEYPSLSERETYHISPSINPGLDCETCLIFADLNDAGYIRRYRENEIFEYTLPKKKNRFKQIADLIEKYL